MDKDNSGELDWHEFYGAVRKVAKVGSAAASDRELERLFEHLDQDGGGFIECANPPPARARARPRPRGPRAA